MASKQSGSAKTGSGNARVLHSDTGISFPLPRSVSTRSVRDIKKKKKKIHRYFLSKIPTENDIDELLTTKWTLTAGFKYITWDSLF